MSNDELWNAIYFNADKKNCWGEAISSMRHSSIDIPSMDLTGKLRITFLTLSLELKLIGSRFRPALVRRNVSMKLFSHSMELTFHHQILTWQVWARGSKVTTDGHC